MGDRFYLCDGKILCQYDYDERVAFAQLAAQYQSKQQPTLQEQDAAPPSFRPQEHAGVEQASARICQALCRRASCLQIASR